MMDKKNGCWNCKHHINGICKLGKVPETDSEVCSEWVRRDEVKIMIVKNCKRPITFASGENIICEGTVLDGTICSCCGKKLEKCDYCKKEFNAERVVYCTEYEDSYHFCSDNCLTEYIRERYGLKRRDE